MTYGRSENGFYLEIVTTDDWQEVDVGFISGNQILICDTANAAHFSYDTDSTLTVASSSKAIHGDLIQNQELQFDNRFAQYIYVKSKVSLSASTLRIYAW